MSDNKLSEIIDLKKNQIEILKKKISIDELNTKISNFSNYLNFKEKIKKNIIENKLSLIVQKKYIVIGKSELDITDKVLDIFNKEVK